MKLITYWAVIVITLVHANTFLYSQEDMPEKIYSAMDVNQDDEIFSSSNINKFLIGTGITAMSGLVIYAGRQTGHKETINIIYYYPFLTSLGIYAYGYYNNERGSLLKTTLYSYLGLLIGVVSSIFIGTGVDDDTSKMTRSERIFYISSYFMLPIPTIIGGIYGYNKSRGKEVHCIGSLFDSTPTDFSLSFPRPYIKLAGLERNKFEKIVYCNLAHYSF